MYTFYVIALTIATLFTLSIAFYARSKRSVNGASMLAWFMLAISGWTICTVISVLSPSEAAAQFWDNQVRYFFIAIFPVFFVAFTLEYAGRDRWLQPRYLLALMVVPLTIQALNWLEPRTFMADMTYIHEKPFWIVESFKPAWGFNVHTAYSYMLTLVGLAILLHKFFKVNLLYRLQVVIIIAGVFIPFIVNIVVVLQVAAIPELDWTSLSFTITGLVWTWALFRYRLFDMMPVAYEVIVQSMDDAVFVLDNENRLVDVNPAALAILGRPANKVIGQPIQKVFVNQHALIQKYLHTDTTRDEVVLGDTQQTYDLRISTLYRRQAMGRLVVLRDITARKQAELERENLIQELKAYAHSVAHDLKNPLGVVVNAIELLQLQDATISPQKRQHYYNMVDRTSGKMVTIIDELLLLASVREMDAIDCQPLAMSAIVSEALSRLSDQVDSTQATIQQPAQWMSAIGYAPWVEEVWMNYLSNALKYGGQPPLLEVGSIPQGPMVRFYVRDNGKGLTPEEQQVVFQRFTRFDQQRAEGHGLGLSIVQRIVERLGGQVGVESEVGQGSTFYFTLPAG